jgi:hypothetical protein
VGKSLLGVLLLVEGSARVFAAVIVTDRHDLALNRNSAKDPTASCLRMTRPTPPGYPGPPSEPIFATGGTPAMNQVNTAIDCQRSARRHAFPEAEAIIEFDYPRPGEHRCEMPLRDLSNAGISFVLTHELPGIAIGETLREIALRVNGRVICGDVLICHLTPGGEPGTVCGGLFYPASDPDLLQLQDLLDELNS